MLLGVISKVSLNFAGLEQVARIDNLLKRFGTAIVGLFLSLAPGYYSAPSAAIASNRLAVNPAWARSTIF